jgi:tetratricopeptide (TPR) repeat protein
MPRNSDGNPWKTWTWGTVAVLSIIWWVIAGEHSLQRTVLLVWLSLSSFVVGCLIGFLFSSYGEESNTLGKIRDWLVGGITALTVANVATIKRVLLVFAAGPGGAEFAFTIAAAVLYSGLGFFFMFFQRELILNVLLAKSRAERDRVEGTQEAGLVIQRLLVRLPPSVLSGVDSVSEIPDVKDKEEQKLKELIYSDEVEKFLEEAEEASRTAGIDWDVVSKAAYISYYRTYFEKENRSAEIAKALQWITRALIMNPLHVDLTTKYADMLAADENYGAAAAVLDRLAAQPESPVFVKQWQGYVLRYIADRLDDSIKLSEQYHSLFPDESDTYFNIAYAYAHKYEEELRAAGLTTKPDSTNREKALSTLKVALSKQADMLEVVRKKWTGQGEAFECLLHDKEFRTIVGLPAEEAVGGGGR